MKVILSKKYKLAQNFGIEQGFQSNDSKVRDLISQGTNIVSALRMVYPNMEPNKIEQLKNYYEGTQNA